MRRREFIIVGGAAAIWSFAARAQRGERMPRIGVFIGYAESDPEAQSFLKAFVDELQVQGWTVGGNLRIDIRWAGADAAQIPALAKDLVELKPDVIFCNSTPVTDALVRATKTVPIVFTIVSDPVGAGFVASLPRPGGNVTGFINVDSSMAGKWLELLKEIAPGVKRVAIMFNPETAPDRGLYFLRPFEAAAPSFAVEPIAAPVHDDGDIEKVITSLGREPGGGLVVETDSFLVVHRATVITQAFRNKVPAMYPLRIHAMDGGLLPYGANNIDLFRRAAPYVDTASCGAQIQLSYRSKCRPNMK